MHNAIGISMGDPEGIGPEVTAKAILKLTPSISGRIRLFGDRKVFERAFKLAGASIPSEVEICEYRTARGGDAGSMAIASLDAAIASAAMGEISALVTAPVNKSRIISSDINFTGHTEYLASKCGAKDVTMMFAGSGKRKIRISLVTTHIGISSVPAAITSESVVKTIRMTAAAISKMDGIDNPRIAICALNPHAGEKGHFGRKEIEEISPAIDLARADGLICSGPHPADALFSPLSRLEFDAAVAMYHDQGMLPAKILSDGKCVNITLGLPFCRTSPGHGSADDIAWLGSADEAPMLEAILAAARLS